ncbi:hypothetical protein [Neptunicoccus cionae]|uniref:COG3904 family protein n=1 Tax=Neptunicoccus cionae TaxID=2035344 RepID=UPI00166A1B5C|nr:hypothetical protein [Amylibacter cionae]
MIHAVRHYAIGHWRGEQGLKWSFWVNLILIRALIFALQDWFAPFEGQDHNDHQVAVLLFVFVFHGVVFVWQAVGVVRASEESVRASGYMAPAWATQLTLIIMVFWVLAFTLEAWQMTLRDPDRLEAYAAMEAQRAAKYSVEPSADGKTLTLSGSIERGITRKLDAQLAAYPNTSHIVLSSPGGNIYEARGLSNAIRKNGLNTLVTLECSSSCTTAFIGGAERFLVNGAKLGFHQFRIDAVYSVLNADPLKEQERDKALFIKSGVAAWFVEEMFNSPSSEIWYPNSSKLLAARVVTKVIDRVGEK